MAVSGCTLTSVNTKDEIKNSDTANTTENNKIVDGKIKPFVNKTLKDQEINIGVPVYKF